MKMRKAINIENSSNNVVRILSIADETIIENNPTGLEYFVIEDYVEPPVINNISLDINYPMYDKVDKKFKWVQVNYQNTASDSRVFEQETLNKLSMLQANINTTNNNINLIVELQADKIGGAI